MVGTNTTDDAHLANCVDKYDLVNPQPSEAWVAYLAQRMAAEDRSEEVTNNSEDEIIYEMTESGVETVLDCTDLNDKESNAVQDGIYILSQEVVGDGDMAVRFF